MRYACPVLPDYLISAALPEQPDAIDPLPPLDTDEDDNEGDDAREDELPSDMSSFIEPIEGEEEIGLDDEVAADLEIGVRLEESEAALPEPAEEIVLDIGELLEDARQKEQEHAAGDDESGPAELDPTAGLTQLGSETGWADEEPASDLQDEPLGELPSIDADNAGDLDYSLDTSWAELDAVGSDEPLRVAEHTWQFTEFSEVTGLCQALAAANAAVLVGGTAVFRVDDEAAQITRLTAEPALVTDIAAVGTAIVYATGSGGIERLDASGARLGGVALGRAQRSARLCLVDSGERVRLWLHLSRHSLLESRDAGLTWNKLEVPGDVVALPRSAHQGRLLLERDGVLYLAEQDMDGSFKTATLGAGDVIKDIDSLLFDARGAVLALFATGSVLTVSRDGGRTLKAAVGCANVTALCCGEIDGAPRVWAAVQHGASSAADLVMIDPSTASAVVIGRWSSPDTEEEDTQVLQLLWDPATRRLWAAGTRGLAALRAPSHS